MAAKMLNDSPSESFAEFVSKLRESETYDIEDARYEISEWIYSAMQKGGKKKAELADSLNTSRAYVTKLLQGNGNYTLETLVKIARALDYKYKPTFIERIPVQTLSLESGVTLKAPSAGIKGGYDNIRLGRDYSLSMNGKDALPADWDEEEQAS